MPKNPLEFLDDIGDRIEKGFDKLEKLGDNIENVFTKIEGRTPTTAPESQKEASFSTKPSSNLSTKDTIAYQNREIGKQLYAMERHYANRMRIRGIPCDCGASKHLLGLEQLSEETIPMVNNPTTYEEIIKWVRENEPKSTDEAAKSGKYDDEYPALSRQARDFRKKIVGSRSLAAMTEEGEGLTPEEARKTIIEQADMIVKEACRGATREEGAS